MTDWIKVEDSLPEEGQAVFYYFIFCGVREGKYMKADPEYGKNIFYGISGFLTDDVTHWMPREEGDPIPEPPND